MILNTKTQFLVANSLLRSGLICLGKKLWRFKQPTRAAKISENNRFCVPMHFKTNRFTFKKNPPPPPLLHPTKLCQSLNKSEYSLHGGEKSVPDYQSQSKYSRMQPQILHLALHSTLWSTCSAEVGYILEYLLSGVLAEQEYLQSKYSRMYAYANVSVAEIQGSLVDMSASLVDMQSSFYSRKSKYFSAKYFSALKKCTELRKVHCS